MYKFLLHKILLLSVFLGLNLVSYAQEDNLLRFSIFETEDTLSVETVINNSHFFNNDHLLEITNPTKTYWIKLDFKDYDSVLNTNDLWYLKFANFDFGTLYFKEGHNIKSYEFGVFNIENDIRSLTQNKKWFFPFKTSQLINKQYIYLKVRRVRYFNDIKNWEFTYVSPQEKYLNSNYYSQDEILRLIPAFIFNGMCIMMSLITLILFSVFKKKEFLFYALYILSFILFIDGYTYNFNFTFFGLAPAISNWFIEIFQVVIIIWYILFIIYYLDTKQSYRRLHSIFKYTIALLCIIIIINGYCYFSEYYSLYIEILRFQRYFVAVFGIIAIFYLFFNAKDPFTYYIVFGSLLFMLGAFSSWVSSISMFTLVGTILEITIFGIGLIYKVRKGYDERIHFEKESYLNNIKALRAQINPHFLFNSLSAIQHLVTKNDRISAIKYLSKFSSLTRSILESSIENNALLSEEIKMLKNYLELEALRFDDAFDYTINVDKTIDTNAIEIPSMLFQPFIENAIIHGLLPKSDSNKTLSINFKVIDNILFCEIDDNGIGRVSASKKTHIHKRDKKSRGIEVTQQRLKSLYGSENNIEIIDKIDDSGNALGTKVVIRIPI